MRYPGFCGGSAASQSVVANAERTMNFYLERSSSRDAPTDAVLYPTPGTSTFLSVAKVGTRALFETANRAFAVIGNGFYELGATQTAILRGTVTQNDEPATISGNGSVGQLLVTSGGDGYCYDLATNVLTQVLTGLATMGGMLDGFFLAFNRTTGIVRLSNLNDGLTWDPTKFFARSLAPDPWRAMIVVNPQVWFIGQQTSEAWYNAGTFPQPFAPIRSSFLEYGTNAPWSAALAGQTLVWLSHTKDGAGAILGVKGFGAHELSTTEVTTAIATIERATGIDDCETLVYRQAGHLFACFSFPAGLSTWVVDVETGDWHERGTWRPTLAQYAAWAPRVTCHAFGRHLAGDRATGRISTLDLTVSSEADGSAIRRVRVAPPLWASAGQRLQVSRFDLRLEAGLGLAVAPGAAGHDPQVMFRSSVDGKRWSPERMASAGPLGEYGRRVFWTRCGSSDVLWQPEIVVSDAVPWRLLGAEIQATGLSQRAA